MMAKFENLKNKKNKKSLHPKFLSDFQNVGIKIFVKSSSITSEKKKLRKKQSGSTFSETSKFGVFGFFLAKTWNFGPFLRFSLF